MNFSGLSPARTTHLINRKQGLTLLELLIVMFIISLLSMVALPMYTDYRTRIKILEDFDLFVRVKKHASEYYAVNGVLPTQNAQVGLNQLEEKNTGHRLLKARLSSAPVPGTLKIWYDNVNEFPELGSLNRINFVPQVVNGQVRWDCNGGNLADKYRPANCRGELVYLDTDDND
jgi:type IV pilus assembly protein PilA